MIGRGHPKSNRYSNLGPIEVESGRSHSRHPGMTAFRDAFGSVRTQLVGGDGILVEELLVAPIPRWLG